MLSILTTYKKRIYINFIIIIFKNHAKYQGKAESNHLMLKFHIWNLKTLGFSQGIQQYLVMFFFFLNKTNKHLCTCKNKILGYSIIIENKINEHCVFRYRQMLLSR